MLYRGPQTPFKQVTLARVFTPFEMPLARTERPCGYLAGSFKAWVRSQILAAHFRIKLAASLFDRLKLCGKASTFDCRLLVHQWKDWTPQRNGGGLRDLILQKRAKRTSSACRRAIWRFCSVWRKTTSEHHRKDAPKNYSSVSWGLRTPLEWLHFGPTCVIIQSLWMTGKLCEMRP